MLTNFYRSIKPVLLSFAMLLVFAVAAAPGALAQDQAATHVVQPGENLFRIALAYGVDMNELAAYNGITDLRHIYAGQVLRIPGVTPPETGGDVVYNPLVAGTPTTHVIQPGETLGSIAQLYGITVEQLMQSNNIADPNRIFWGQSLTVWASSDNTSAAQPQDAAAAPAPSSAPNNGVVHVVQRGEHLSMIAQLYGTTWTAIAQANGITDPNHIYAGQQLIIPDATSSFSPPPSLTGGDPGATITTGKEIVVDLSDSKIYAYQDGQLVRTVLVSTGLPATPTVVGDFTIQRKFAAQTMVGPGYYLPDVPWVMYFYEGYAIHGTYWHNNFGHPMSHGCVNLPTDESLWFYDFAPLGTPVHVQY